MATIASLLIDLGANVARLQQDMSQAARVVDRGVNDMTRSIQRVKSVFQGVLAGTGVALFAREIAKSAMEAEQASARLEAVLRATGHSAGIAKSELDEMADAMALTTQFDDESIRNAQAVFLKFGDIQEDVFRRAMKVAADYAAFSGKSIPEAAQALGQAMKQNGDSIGRLSRDIGALSFTQAENLKTLREQGKVTEAYGAVLDIIEGKIGGTAAAMNTGLTKAVRDITKAWNELLETMGKTDTGHSAMAGLASLLRDIKATIEGTRNPLRELLIDILDLLDKVPTIRALGVIGLGTSRWREDLSRSSVSGTIRNPAAEASALAAAAQKARDEAKASADAERAAADAKKREAEGRAAAAKALAAEKKLLEEGTRGWVEYAEAVFTAAEAELNALNVGPSFTQWAEKQREAVLDNLDPTRAWAREIQELIKLFNTGYLSAQQFHQASMNPQLRALLNPAKTDWQVLNEALKEGDISLDKYLEVSKRLTGETKEIRTVWQDIGDIISSSAEDALRNWQGVGNLIRSIGMDIATLIFRKQVAEPAANFFSGAIDSIIKGIMPKAAGGAFGAGDTMLVGERGPELVQFNRGGTVIPNDELGGGGVTIIMNQSFGSDVNRATLVTWGKEVVRQAEAAVAERIARGHHAFSR